MEGWKCLTGIQEELGIGDDRNTAHDMSGRLAALQEKRGKEMTVHLGALMT